jgi:hypothetical protein
MQPVIVASLDMSSQWKDTILWESLCAGAQANGTCRYLEPALEEVETLLAKGGTAPLDFTLHDDDHSFRVAQRMAELLPADTLEKLSTFEIGLLLQSAYLHDIGMNPRRSIVLQVRDLLLHGVRGDLKEEEVHLLQLWLDENHSGIEPPLKAKTEQERLSAAEWYTAHFTRHRHNDWSEEFIRSNSERYGKSPYPTWTEDLTLLCKSHHFGYSDLLKPEFDIRIVPPGNQLVNLRYLAAVLRTADVLEFDPERSPEVVLAHRSISESSRIFWHKDHEIALSLDQKNYALKNHGSHSECMDSQGRAANSGDHKHRTRDLRGHV